MFKKIAFFAVSGFLLLNICGCFLLVAGAVGGTGTAVWLSGKLTQQFNASYERTVNAARSALRSLGLEVTREAKEANVTTFRSRYADGKEIWVDVRRIADLSTKVEVRVGGISPDKGAAEKILKRIQNHL